MTLKIALSKLRKIGVANATGESLAASYANLVSSLHGGKPELYFEHLSKFPNDKDMSSRAKILLEKRSIAWDILIGIENTE